jgi:predicted nuclease with TOPRIM domain
VVIAGNGETVMNADAVGQLMNVILQMQINLAHITETFSAADRSVRQQLEIIFEEEKKVLDGCLNGIDERLKECSALVEDYKKNYAELSVMSERLRRLGAEPSPLPAGLPADRVEGVVAWRLQELRAQGRI